MIPKYLFLTKGVGKHKDPLQSFFLALRNAGIQHCNLVNVSSIVPPGCKIIPKEKGLKMTKPGEITFAVLSKYEVSIFYPRNPQAILDRKLEFNYRKETR